MGNPFSGSSGSSVKSGLQNMGQMASGGMGGASKGGSQSNGLQDLFTKLMASQNPNAIGTLDRSVATEPGQNNQPLSMYNYGG